MPLRPRTALWARFVAALRDLSLVEDRLPPSASADRTVCDGLAHPLPTCLAAVRGSTSSMRSNQLLLPTASIRVLAPHSFPASFRDLRLALSRGLLLEKRDWGTLRFMAQKGSASAGCSGSRVALSSTYSRSCRASDIPVASPKRGLAGFRARSKSSMMPRLRLQVPHEEQPTSLARDAFHRQLSRVRRGCAVSKNGHVRVSASKQRRCPFAPIVRAFARLIEC